MVRRALKIPTTALVAALIFTIALPIQCILPLAHAAESPTPQGLDPSSSAQLGSALQGAQADAQPTLTRLNSFFDQLAESPAGTAPTAKDTFHLLQQKLVVHPDDNPQATPQAYNLARVNIARPHIRGVRRDLSFSVDSTTGSLVFKRSLLRNHTHTAHVVNIAGETILKAELDKRGEFITILTDKGELYSIDFLIAQTVAFNAPMPLIKVGSVNPDRLAQFTGGFRTNEDRVAALNELTLEFVTMGTTPANFNRAELISESSAYMQDGIMRAGDLLVRDQQHRAVALFDRDAMLIRQQMGLFYLLTLAHAADPDFGAEAPLRDLNRAFTEVIGNDAAPLTDFSRTPLEQEALMNIQTAAHHDIFARVAAHASTGHGLNAARLQATHRFTFDEWKTHHAKLQARTNSNTLDAKTAWVAYLNGTYTADGEMRDPQKTTFTKRMRAKLTARSLQNTAYKVATSPALWVSAGLLGADQLLFNGIFFSTISHIAYEALYPDIWADVQYRWPLAYSIALQTTEIALIYGIGAMVVKAIDKAKLTNEAVINRIISASLKTFALFQYPVLHLMARVARQFNLFSALKHGHVTADAVNSPFLSQEDQQQQAERFNQSLTRKKRLASYARTMAYLVAADQTGIDPATLIHEPASLDKKDLKDYEQRWQLIAHNLYMALLESPNNELLSADLSQMNAQEKADFQEEITTHYNLARQTAERLYEGGAKGSYRRVLAQAQMRWKNLTQKSVPQFLYRFFGPDMYETLFNAKPDSFVTTATWRQFVIDYGFAIPVQMLWGPRADVGHPENLAVRPQFPYTSSPMLADNQEQVLTYLLRSPAENYLVFNSKPASYDGVDHYGAADRMELDESQEATQGFGAGLSQFMRTAADLRRAEYGTYVAKKYQRVWSTLQGRMGMGVPLRMTIGAKTFGIAVFAQLQATMMAMWAYGWPWPIIIRSLQMYDGDITAAYNKFKNAQIMLAESLRLGENNRAELAASTLRDLYSNAHRGVRHMVRLTLAHNASAGADANTIEQLSPLELLDLSQRVPPVPKKSNSFVADFVTWIGGAIPTTVMALTLMNHLYSPEFEAAPVTNLALGAAKVLGLYTAVYMGQSAFNRIYDRVAPWASRTMNRCKAALTPTSK